MIRINLLAEGRRPVAAGPSRWASLLSGGEGLAQWLFLGLALLGLLVVLGNFLLLRSRAAAKEVEVAAMQREVDELAPIIKEVEEFKAKKVALERKVQAINDLKSNQRGPVRIMDQVSRALPELLWLSGMQVTGESITLTGEAFNTNAVANFIENLDKVPEFQEPNLKDTTQRGAVYNFVVSFNYSSGPPPAPETAPRPTTAGS